MAALTSFGEARMRRHELTLIAAIAILLSGCATPRSKPLGPVVNIPAQVVAEFDAAVRAWNAGNLNGFLSIYAPEATFALADEHLQGRASIGEFYAANFQPGAVRDELTMERLDVEVLSPEVALVRGIYRNSKAGQVTRRGTTTLVMRNMGGVWQIIHDHSN